MGGFTRESIAERAGVPAGYVDRLVELGILDHPKPGASFTEGDVRRVRLIRGMEEGGLPLTGMATVIRAGALSLGFLDLPSWDWYGGFVGKTYKELSSETGLPVLIADAPLQCVVLGAGASLEESAVIAGRPRRRRRFRRRRRA